MSIILEKNDAIELANGSMSESRKAIDSLKEESDSLRASIGELKLSFEQESSQKAELNEVKAALEAEVESLKRALDQRQSENQGLAASNDDLTNQLATVIEEKDNLVQAADVAGILSR